MRSEHLLPAIGLAAGKEARTIVSRDELTSIKDRLLRLTSREREALHHVFAGRLNNWSFNCIWSPPVLEFQRFSWVHDELGSRERCIAAGATAYLIEPVQKAALVTAIDDAIDPA